MTYDTFKKWQLEFDRECSTITWLNCETSTAPGGKRLVEKLKCKVCTSFADKIRSRKNFSEKWIVGADSVRTSYIRDHLHNDQHMHAITLLKKERSKASGLGPALYAHIAKAFNNLPDDA